MKKIICLMLFVISVLSVNLASATPDEQSITTSFQALAKKHIDGYKSDPRILVYFIPGHISGTAPEGWRKSKCVVNEDYTCDIQKTDSLTTPYKAYLIYKMNVLVSPPFPTKELAENTEVFNANATFKAHRITFSFQDGKWIPEKYEYEFQVERSLKPFWFEIRQNPTYSPYQRVVVKDLDS
ncbi:MAG: hypothetical protein H6Q72_1418 [Firmicutes bacterium]|nr:hypothetical protein [Bacillota bacterium]